MGLELMRKSIASDALEDILGGLKELWLIMLDQHEAEQAAMDYVPCLPQAANDNDIRVRKKRRP